MINGEWWFKRRELIKDLLEGSNDEVLTQFLKDEKDLMCSKCKHWDHNFVGHYDSGNMAICLHPKMLGRHHPSAGCGTAELTMAYVPNVVYNSIQEIQTRWNFGCLLWERKDE